MKPAGPAPRPRRRRGLDQARAQLLLLAVAGLVAGAADTHGGVETMATTSRYAVVSADPRVEGKAARVAALVDENAPRIAAIVGAEDLRPIPVLVHGDRAAMLEAAGLPARTAIVGLATFPAGVVHLDGTERLASIERVLPHELAHVFIARAVGPALPAAPLWLSEGIAEYAAGATASQVDPFWVRVLGEGRSLELGELDGAIQSHGDDAGLAYAQSASIIGFLVAERGQGVIADLLRAIARRRDFGAALRETTGWQEGELEAAWRRQAFRRWGWPLLLQPQPIFFGVMVMLFLAGLVRYLRQRKRRQESSEDDW